ncbi:LPS-assembly lipoprotein [Pseudomonas duriflava]|uniref:LPS-assembly lipoprotein LptE n=1 Tax=Pseudomonas duriflava TaxID=459528 RepID=A0A562QBW1_9PSED|nr:LPS assembly lipoprotein LptE [Pseudomonas duriflava]TWI54247.1 LPS-assembly lipoprotein [Pseudomonas duriflava]
MMKRSLSCLAIVGIAVLLSACGFHLRGTGETQLSLRELNLSARDSYGDTVRQVRTMLENNHVRINAGAPYTLYLAGEQQTQRTASYTSGARSAEIELSTRLPYEIRGRNDAVLLREELDTQRSYVTDENNIIGSEQQSQQLRTEMRAELVRQLASRLQVITPQRLETLQNEADARAQAEQEAARAARESMPPQQSPIEIPSR